MHEATLVEPVYAEGEIVGLPYFHGRRFAVVLTNGGLHLALRGIARYAEDNEGSVLRIEVDDETQPNRGHTVFVIREEIWDGRFVPDHEYGCEFQFRLDADAVRN